LAWRQDGNGRVTKYQYDPLDRLLSVTDSNDVPLVQMEYDVLGNLTRVASTHSVLEYAYDGLNRVTNAVCTLTNIPGFAPVKYQIAYAFDAVGNLTNRLINGLMGFTNSLRTRYEYDVMNRLTNVVQWADGQETGRAAYQYDLAGRLWKKTYGNGDVVTHGYDAEGRLVSLGITNGTAGVWWSTYQWDAGGNILAITNNGTNVNLYSYDRTGQLTNEIVFTNGLAGGQTNVWEYDEAGNWLNASANSRWVYNLDNELMARVPIAAATNMTVTVTGEVEPGPNSNKWYNTWAECRGVSAQVSQLDGTFSLPGVPLYPGTNTLVVRVRDVSGNEAEQVRTVVRTNALETFQYDGNGNLTNWVNGTENWAYEWDWADRLIRVVSNNVVVLQNWYDASSRRIAKTEVLHGQTNQWLYLYDGWDIVGVMNGNNGQIRETFTRGVGLAGDIGALVTVTHHAGANAGTYYTHCNHRGDIVLTRSGTATVGRYDYGAFGALKSQIGADISRFKFSSKERDASTRFSYYGYRFYAPAWQRWVSPDPIEEEGGSNVYGFVTQDPVNWVDASGLGKAKPKPKFRIPKPKTLLRLLLKTYGGLCLIPCMPCLFGLGGIEAGCATAPDFNACVCETLRGSGYLQRACNSCLDMLTLHSGLSPGIMELLGCE
jgi:RHS repeat-associated protein